MKKLEIEITNTALAGNSLGIEKMRVKVHEGVFKNKEFEISPVVIRDLLQGCKLELNEKQLREVIRGLPSAVSKDKKSLEFLQELRNFFGIIGPV